MISYSFLQDYWWFVMSLLGGLLVFLLFVQGGQTLLYSISRDEKDRVLLVNALGRKWEYTFTTLVTFGGAFFASFPYFYATSFGGAYWVWMLILFCFVLQAVSYEFQSKPGNVFGQKVYRGFLYFNGLAGTFLLGAAVATFFTGSPFTVGKANLTDVLNPTISRWGTAWHGLDALTDPRNWALGLAVFFLARTLASLFFINRLADDGLVKRSRRALMFNAIPFLITFLTFIITIFLSQGFAVNPTTGEVTMEAYKYFFNLVEMPIVGICFLVGVVLVLFGIGKGIFDKTAKSCIWFAGIGTVMTVCCLFLIAGWNNTAFYPSYLDLNSSLTIQNASSSEFTLSVMAVISLFVPFVIAYIFYAWNALEKKPLKIEDLPKDGHIY